MDKEVYTGKERRRANTLEMEAIEAVVEKLMNRVIAEHEAREEAMWEATMKKAFPDGDHEAHKAYHQTKINAAKAEQEFWATLKVRIAETGIVGMLRLLIYLMFLGLTATFAARFGFMQTFLTWLGSKG